MSRPKDLVIGPAEAKLFLDIMPSGNSDECWVWPLAGRKRGGYGQFHVGRKFPNRMAHRVAYHLLVAAVPSGILVLHSCDNPICVNPAHLFLGTNAANTRDMFEKGREPKHIYKTGALKGTQLWKLRDPESTRGTRNGRAVLSENEVALIRAERLAGHSYRVIAERYGVHQSTVALLIQGKHWKHVP